MSANLAGLASIMMWSLLAVLVAKSGNVPPFLLLGLTFSVAVLVGAAFWLVRRPKLSLATVPLKAWLVGVIGLSGYHYLYYVALQNAPVAEANLINYLWPLLIVLGSTFLPNEKLKLHHVLGAILGFVGAALLIGQTIGASASAEFPNLWLGYFAAILCAFFWSTYSVLSSSFKKIPTEIVLFYCLATALMAFGAHVAFEETVWPTSASQWTGVLLLGLMPVGGAFYTWDFAMKKGNIQLLGSLCYFIPVISTFILVWAGISEFSYNLAGATILVTLGALMAAGKMGFTK